MNLRTLDFESRRRSEPTILDRPTAFYVSAIRAGDRTARPPLDSEEPALADGLICH